jgi:hypothetical protein
MRSFSYSQSVSQSVSPIQYENIPSLCFSYSKTISYRYTQHYDSNSHEPWDVTNCFLHEYKLCSVVSCYRRCGTARLTLSCRTNTNTNTFTYFSGYSVCLRTGCNEYLDERQKIKKDGENCIIMSFRLCTLH